MATHHGRRVQRRARVALLRRQTPRADGRYYRRFDRPVATDHSDLHALPALQKTAARSRATAMGVGATVDHDDCDYRRHDVVCIETIADV